MSFLKITDPKKRDFMVEEFLKRKRGIQDNFMAEKLGDIGLSRELSKLYKPLTDSQAKITESIKESAVATTDVIKALPASLKAIRFPQYPSIEGYEDPVEDVRTLELGEMAVKYLKQYASNKKIVDTTFGIHSKDGVFYIGDTEITIENDDISVDDKVYAGTPGLWELLTMNKPDTSLFADGDMKNYEEILVKTNAMRQLNNPNKPKSSRSYKYNNIIKPIWENRMKTGQGVVILPSDPSALTDMLALRIASFNAGNTGVRNEIVSICDELLRQGAIDTFQYKKLMNHI